MKTDLYYHNIEIIEGKILTKYIYLLQLRLQQDSTYEDKAIRAIELEIQTVLKTISNLEAKKVLLTL